MRSKSNQANERNVSIEKRILSWHDSISQYGASNYLTLYRHKNADFSQDSRVTRQGFLQRWIHTALAGTVPIDANRPCLSSQYQLYAALQVTLLVL
jgi:endo-beta-N-acetylglucosaminidase D